MNSLIIINSMNTRSDFTNRLVEVLSVLSKNNYNITIKFTKRAHDTFDIVKKEGKYYSLLVIAGGDGTLNEVVDGLRKTRRKPKIMYFPTGTVNDFGNSLGIPKQFKKQLSILTNQNSRYVDSGLVNNRCFNYVCAFGPFTSTSYNTSHKLKNRFGKLAYFLNIGSEIPKISELHNLEINIDNQHIEGSFISALIVNSKSVAGFKSFMKNDELDDGYFNLILIKKASPIMLTKGMAYIIEGKNEDFEDEYYIFKKFKKLSLKCPDEIEWTLDGEKGPIGSIDVKVLKHNLEFLVQ